MMSPATFDPEDTARLREAKRVLERPGLAIRLAGLVGTPFERAVQRLPGKARGAVAEAAEAAVRQCLGLALRTLDAHAADGAAAEQPWNRLHKLAAAATGAAGGAFGLAALTVELPVTTTIIFRSICDIARSEGEDLDHAETRLQCLAVLALGGGAREDGEGHAGSGGEGTESAYFALRAGLGEMIAQALAGRGAGRQGDNPAPRVSPLLDRIAERFSIQVTQQAAAKSLPAVGAVLGALVNTVFMDHFQKVAQAHFRVRRLERKYGAARLRAHYDAL